MSYFAGVVGVVYIGVAGGLGMSMGDGGEGNEGSVVCKSGGGSACVDSGGG